MDVSRENTLCSPVSITLSVVLSTTGVPAGHFAESSPQLANTCLPSVKQMAEAMVSDRIILEAPRA